MNTSIIFDSFLFHSHLFCSSFFVSFTFILFLFSLSIIIYSAPLFIISFFTTLPLNTFVVKVVKYRFFLLLSPERKQITTKLTIPNNTVFIVVFITISLLAPHHFNRIEWQSTATRTNETIRRQN